MSITIKKYTNGNVSFFDDVTLEFTSYVEAYKCETKEGIVFVTDELSGIQIVRLDFNNVTSVTDSSDNSVTITSVELLYTQLITNVFFKTV